MNKKILLLSASAALVLTACGDENTTNVTEFVGPKTLAKGETLKDYKCSKDNIGEFAFVTDSASVFYCDGEDWQSLKGEKGEDGSSCTTKKNSDGDYELTCDGKKVGTIKNGEDGKEGSSCTAKKNSDGDFDLSCDGEKVGTIKNGKNGDPGKEGSSCTAKKNSNGDFDLSCDGKKVGTIKNGESAASGNGCKFDEAEGGVVTITCGEDSPVTLYKAMCGTVSYDPEVDACIVGYLSCGVNVDDLKGVSFESDEFEEKYFDKFYDPQTSFCRDGLIYDFCEGKSYDPAKQYCMNDSLIDAKCKGVDYSPLKDHCVDDQLVENPECKGVKYFPETQYCSKGEIKFYGYYFDEFYAPVHLYKTVEIGNQEWFAENMNRVTKDSKCVENDADDDGNCKTYGRLYTYTAASNVCPNGWKLPTEDEVNGLTYIVGENTAADVLKSTTGWGGEGLDVYGFAALAAGMYNTSESLSIGEKASFWTQTLGDRDAHEVMVLNKGQNDVKINLGQDAFYYSVRCMRIKYVVKHIN